MKGLRGNIRALLVAFVLMFCVLASYIGYSMFVNGTRYFTSPYNPMLAQQIDDIVVGSILDRDGEVLAESDPETGERKYNSNVTVRRALSHTVGDPYGLTTGIEIYQAQYLLGFSSGMLERLRQSISSEKRHGDDVVTTLSSELAAYALEQLGNQNGSVVVMNYQTGEIYASVSAPNFDPQNLSRPTAEDDAANDGQGYLVNRATMGKYTPGSVFKLVTAAAALESRPALLEKTYTCTGKVEYPNGTVVCSGNAVHGRLTFSQALARSCNCCFAQIAEDLGASALKEMAEKLGYNEEFLFDDLIVYQSSYVPASEGTLDYAWSAVGQYQDTASPIHVNMITCAIANGGQMMEPKLVREVRSAGGQTYDPLTPEVFRTVMSANSAGQLREMMELAVTSGTARRAALEDYTVAGKTGTAEVSDTDSKQPHAWFTGFVVEEEHPLAITVIVENGGGGGSVAAPIAQKVLQKAIDLGL